MENEKNNENKEEEEEPSLIARGETAPEESPLLPRCSPRGIPRRFAAPYDLSLPSDVRWWSLVVARDVVQCSVLLWRSYYVFLCYSKRYMLSIPLGCYKFVRRNFMYGQHNQRKQHTQYYLDDKENPPTTPLVPDRWDKSPGYTTHARDCGHCFMRLLINL